MGSLNSPGSIDIVDKQNANWRNEGGAIVASSGLFPQGVTSQKISTVHLPQGHDRSSAEFGTQPNRATTQYSTLCIAPAKKIATSDDGSLNDGLINRHTEKVAPSSTDQPEIRLKPVSQRSTYNTGNKVVVRNSDDDSLVGRQGNDSFIPGP